MKRLGQLNSQKIKWIMAFCIFLVFFTSSDLSFATEISKESWEYGYVDIQKVLEKSPAWAKAEQELEKLRQEKQIQINKKEKEVNELKQNIIKGPNKDSLIFLGALTLTLKEKNLKNLKIKAQKEIEQKKEEIVSGIKKELMWEIKRFGKANNYGIILSKEGRTKLGETSVLDHNTIFYQNNEMDLEKISVGIEDFENISQKVIAFINEGDTSTIVQNQISNSTEPKKESHNLEIVAQITTNELFPVIAKLLNEGKNPFNIPDLIKWHISNKSNSSVSLTVVSEIPDWTPAMSNTINLNPYESKEISQTPFGIKLFNNHMTVPGMLSLKVKVGDKILYDDTKNIQIRASDDMIWSLHIPWDTEYLIAAWVTPKDPVVEQILARAKEKLFGRSLAGYLKSSVRAEVKAIFNAVRDIGVSYVNSTVNFGQVGFTQRVRLPRESIAQKSANCIDGAVLLASLFENIGLEPLIILVPGHAFVGVKLAPGAKETLFIETTLLGREMLESILTGETTFDAAVRAANERYIRAYNESRYKPDALRIIDIKKTREIGIYPLW